MDFFLPRYFSFLDESMINWVLNTPARDSYLCHANYGYLGMSGIQLPNMGLVFYFALS